MFTLFAAAALAAGSPQMAPQQQDVMTALLAEAERRNAGCRILMNENLTDDQIGQIRKAFNITNGNEEAAFVVGCFQYLLGRKESN